MATLRISQRVRTELRRAVEILRLGPSLGSESESESESKHWLGTQASLADYLIVEHNCVVDTGALPIIMELEHELLSVDPYTVVVSQRAVKILVGLARVFTGSVGRDAIGSFILLENIPIVLYAPDLFPGLATAVPTPATNGGKLYDPYVWVYKGVLRLLSLQTALRTDQEAFQAFASMDIVGLAALLETPAWQDFKYVCSLWGADAERVRVGAPHDFAARLAEAARELKTSVVHIASFVLWNEIRATELPTGDISELSVASLLRHAMTIGD